MIKTPIYRGILQSDLELNGFSAGEGGGGSVTELPVGGTTGQSLTKNSNTDFDVEWSTITSGSGGGLPEGWVSVLDYGAKHDAKLVTDAAMTSGSPTLTSATAAFTSADIGKKVSINGVGASGGILQTTISAFTNSTTVTLAANAGTSASAQYCAFGTDNTPLAQAAIAAAGSTVYFPAGNYFFAGKLTVSRHNISLVGANCFGTTGMLTDSFPTVTAMGGGTCLLQTANPGDASVANAFIYVTGSNVTVIGFTFFWPNQLPGAATPTMYPWAIAVYGIATSTIKYCEFVNAYECIYVELSSAVLIEETRGQALFLGIRLKHNMSVTRLRGCYFDQAWNTGASAVYQANNAIAFDLGRNDGLIMEGCFCFRYKCWVHCWEMDPSNDGPWAQIIGGGGDMCSIAIWCEQTSPQGIDFIGVHTSSASTYAVAPNVGIQIEATCSGAVRMHGCMIHSEVGKFGILKGSGEVIVNGSYFVADAGNGVSGSTVAGTGWDASLHNGNFALRDCTFRTTQTHVVLGGSMIRAVVTGNMATGAVQITNNMTAGWAVIDNNQDGGTRYIGTDARLTAITGGVKLECRNTGTGVWVEATRYTNP